MLLGIEPARGRGGHDRAAAARLRALGPRAVLVKGGHLEAADSIDVLDDGGEPLTLAAPRIATANTHGTGCTLSSAIAALLAPRAAAARRGAGAPRPISPRRSGRRIGCRSATATARCIISTRSGGTSRRRRSMSFSQDAWQRIAPLYAAILELPFNRELAAGTLSRERFTFYMLQDAHYLTYFARALAVTAARAPDNDALIQFAGSAREAVVVERALHEGFFRSSASRRPRPRPRSRRRPARTTPTTSWRSPTMRPTRSSVAALLPCFWIYWEVGKHLLGIAAADNPYQAWIDTYADEAFAEGVRKVIAIGDQIAAAASPTIRDQMPRPSCAPPSWNGCSGTAPSGSSAGRSDRIRDMGEAAGAGLARQTRTRLPAGIITRLTRLDTIV